MKLIFELFLTFLKIGTFTFGGGLAMLPLMRKAVVEEKGWMTEGEMTDCLRLRQLSAAQARVLRWAGLAAVVALAAALRFSNLSAIGYANHYYTAAIKSMLQSWHNFFFVAAEPGGAVSVDKPPLGLWLEAAFASVLGVNGFAVVLPQILAGLGSVVVLYHLVRRSFGTAAGLLAAGLSLVIQLVFRASGAAGR
jgi:hypothetical protein